MEKKLCELHTLLEHSIKENGLSDDLLKKHLNEFKRLKSYMDENSISIYSSPVGVKYLKFRDNLYSGKKQPKFRYDKRYITLLDGMLVNKWVKKVANKDFNIPFPGPFGNYLIQFLKNYCEENRLHIRTRNNYYRSLFRFCERMQHDNVCSIQDITAERLLNFVSSIHNCRDHVVIILRAAVKKMYKDSLIDYRTATILDQLKKKSLKKLPSYYSSQEVFALENKVERISKPGKRDYAMILLATRLGLRSSDIRYLKFSNIDWEENIIRLEQYKTKKIVELPLLIDVGEALIDYIKNGRPKSDSKYIFLRAVGPYDSISDAALYNVIRKYLAKTNVDVNNRKIGSHTLRHSLATNMLKNGTSIVTISETLGHASTVTTMDYLHLDTNGLLQCSLDVPLVDVNFYAQW